MNPLDNLTVCITSFGRAQHLERALKSCSAAGIRRITIAAVEPTTNVRIVIDHWRDWPCDPWLSFDVSYVEDDIGCNATWLVAAYRARTKRILVLHDDDVLHVEFASMYRGLISPMMDAGAGFATWQGDLVQDDGTRKRCDFWDRHTGIRPSTDLLDIVGRFGTLSLSPIVSVLDRETTIHACKEAEQTLTANVCLHRPGMLLGTEILVYLRHIQKFNRWLYLHERLSGYGSHPDSGTVIAQKTDQERVLANGYDVARTQSTKPAPAPLPRLILACSWYPQCSAEETERNRHAYASWQWHFGTGKFIELPIPDSEVRTSEILGDFRRAAFVKDIFDRACEHALPEDIVVYANRDVGMTAPAAQRLLKGIARGRGVTTCFRRSITPKPGRLYHSIMNCRHDGGFDIMAFTPAWWKAHRDKMPDMVIGREVWDTVFRTLADEWVTDKIVTDIVQDLVASPAYTDDVCWHKEHVSDWQIHRKTSPGNLHNLRLAQAFYVERGITLISDSLPRVPVE